MYLAKAKGVSRCTGGRVYRSFPVDRFYMDERKQSRYCAWNAVSTSENGEVMDVRNIFLPKNRDVDASSAELSDVPLCMLDSQPERRSRRG